MVNIDNVVLERIKAEKGYIDPSSDLYKMAERVSSSVKVLTKPVTPMKLKDVSSEVQLGCCAEFISMYNKMLETAPEHCTINVMGKEFNCCKEAYNVLKVLGVGSIHSCLDRVNASAAIFQYIFMTVKSGDITLPRLHGLVQDYKPNGYYEKEIMKAMKVCLFNENQTVFYWLSLVEGFNFYKEAIDAGCAYISDNSLDNKSLKTLLSAKYSEAKADKDFMKDIYKPAANKWLIGMLYILKDIDPSLQLPTPHGDSGFM